MKVLLASLNSKYVHSNLALKYLYTAVTSDDVLMEIKEFTINNDDSYIFREILGGKYDVICFSCYIWNIEETLYLVENIKKGQPNVTIVFGGPEVSYDAAEFMAQNKNVDFVVMGEGENTFACLINELASGEGEYREIKGLAYRNNNGIFANEQVESLAFESVAFPYSLLPCENDKIIYYQSSRGCPFNCSYCMSSLEKKLRALPLKRVFQEIDFFISNNVRQVKFIDRTFNWDIVRCNEILKHIIKNDNGTINFHFEICGEFIDDEFIKLLETARNGLFKFEVGIQTTYKKTLEAVNRSTEIEKVLAKTRRITALENVHVHVDLIAGLPFESYDVFKTTFNETYELLANTLQLGFLKLLKGTQIRKNAENYSYEYRRKAPYEVISNEFLSAQDLCRLKQIEEILDLYYNRNGFEKTLKYIIETFACTPFEFFEEFAIFYNLKEFQHKSHKKEDLYRILYAYGQWKTKKLNVSIDEFLVNLTDDMKSALNPDAVKKFERKGWIICSTEKQQMSNEGKIE